MSGLQAISKAKAKSKSNHSHSSDSGDVSSSKHKASTQLGSFYSAGPILSLSSLVQAKVTIGHPTDRYEHEANTVAETITTGREVPSISRISSYGQGSFAQRKEEPVQTLPVQLQVEEEEEPVQTLLVQRQVEEEEEPVQTLPIQRQADQEEEPVQTLLVQRQADQEEEPVQTLPVHRQAEEEEEELVQTKPNSDEITPQIQRQEAAEEEEELVQAKPITEQTPPLIQRQAERAGEEEKEETLQSKPLASQITPLVQRQPEPVEEEEELQETPVFPKLTVGAPEDEYERQADQVAEKVMRMPDSDTSQILEEKEEQPGQSGVIQTKPDDSYTSPKKFAKTIHSPISGSRLSEHVRAKVEPVLGRDLSHVQVHSDHNANQAAQSLHAKAFTHKNTIWLGAGQSPNDLQLMAHEATHVAQQTNLLHKNNIVKSRLMPIRNLPDKRYGPSANREVLSQAEQFPKISKVGTPIVQLFRHPLISWLTPSPKKSAERGYYLYQYLKWHPIQLAIPSLSPSYIFRVISHFSAIQNLVKSISSFFRGLCDGAKRFSPESVIQRIPHARAQRDLNSLILISLIQKKPLPSLRMQMVLFEAGFFFGAAEGIVLDLWMLIKSLYQIVKKPEILFASIASLVNIITSDSGPPLAYNAGYSIPESLGDHLEKLSKRDVFNFGRGLGKLLGPLILSVIMSILLSPGALGAKAAQLLLKGIEKSRKLLYWIKRVPSRLKDSNRIRKVLSNLDPEIRIKLEPRIGSLPIPGTVRIVTRLKPPRKPPHVLKGDISHFDSTLLKKVMKKREELLKNLGDESWGRNIAAAKVKTKDGIKTWIIVNDKEGLHSEAILFIRMDRERAIGLQIFSERIPCDSCRPGSLNKFHDVYYGFDPKLIKKFPKKDAKNKEALKIYFGKKP